jgi:hypothetical protein
MQLQSGLGWSESRTDFKKRGVMSECLMEHLYDQKPDPSQTWVAISVLTLSNWVQLFQVVHCPRESAKSNLCCSHQNIHCPGQREPFLFFLKCNSHKSIMF